MTVEKVDKEKESPPPSKKPKLSTTDEVSSGSGDSQSQGGGADTTEHAQMAVAMDTDDREEKCKGQDGVSK